MARGEGRKARGALELPPALLPVIVAAIAVPIVAAFALGGPAAGMAVGALAAAAIIVVAVRQKPEGPIEVARSARERPRLLVVIDEPVEEPNAAQEVAGAARALAGEATGAEPEVLVLVPARNRPLAHWLSDVGEARLEAQRRLVLTLGALTAAGLDARGEVGDPDPLQAIEDALRRFAADEVLLVPAPGPAEDELLPELRQRLVIPVLRLGTPNPNSL